MKLKFECFEGLSCFSIRDEINESHHRILEIGLETHCKTLTENLVINLTLATFKEPTTKYLIGLKKKISALTKFEIQWISHQKGLGDFSTIDIFTSRLSGFKLRQIGERIQLEDEVYLLQMRTQVAEAKVAELGGGHDRAQSIILENRVLKAQERILRESIHWQEERMKLQTNVKSPDVNIDEKLQLALAEFNKASPEKVDI